MTYSGKPGIARLGSIRFAGEAPWSDADVQRAVSGLPRQAFVFPLGLAAHADRTSPTAQPGDGQDRQAAHLIAIYGPADGAPLVQLLKSDNMMVSCSSRAALRVAQYLIVYGDSTTPILDEDRDRVALIRNLFDLVMRLDHAWVDEQIATVGDDSDLRAYQTHLFHSTGQTRWKTLPAYEVFVEMLPRLKIADAQSETFRNMDQLVESAFGFSVLDAIAFSYRLGWLAYEWETCLYCLFMDPGLVVSDAQQPNERILPWFNPEREPALRSWLQYHSDDLDEKARISSLDLRTWSGFGFSSFYRKPFIQTGEDSFMSTRIEWIQNLGSVECIYHLCREALAKHGLPDKGWRSYFGRLLEEYVVAEVGRLKPRNVWRENNVPGLEKHDGPSCDVVVETRDGYSLIEVKATVPDVKVATGDDATGFDHYLRRISVGLHSVAGETDLKKAQPPLRQIEGTLTAANLDSSKPTIAAVVTGSHVPIHLGHFDRMAGWWQEEVGSGGGPTGLMYGCRFLPIDASGIAAIVAKPTPTCIGH